METLKGGALSLADHLGTYPSYVKFVDLSDEIKKTWDAPPVSDEAVHSVPVA
jgi:hypothetical protein